MCFHILNRYCFPRSSSSPHHMICNILLSYRISNLFHNLYTVLLRMCKSPKHKISNMLMCCMLNRDGYMENNCHCWRICLQRNQGNSQCCCRKYTPLLNKVSKLLNLGSILRHRRCSWWKIGRPYKGKDTQCMILNLHNSRQNTLSNICLSYSTHNLWLLNIKYINHFSCSKKYRKRNTRCYWSIVHSLVLGSDIDRTKLHLNRNPVSKYSSWLRSCRWHILPWHYSFSK